MSRCRKCEPVPEEVRGVADLLGKRWQLAILYAAHLGAVRFGEFADSVGGVSARMLTERLRELEEAGLMEREVIPTSPPQVEYRLTERGKKLGPVLEAMQQYAVEVTVEIEVEVEVEVHVEDGSAARPERRTA